MRYDDDYYAEEPPMFAPGELAGLTEQQLFKQMNDAYAKQAHVVDAGGSDYQSEQAEMRCNLLEKEIKRRNLSNAYWESVDC